MWREGLQEPALPPLFLEATRIIPIVSLPQLVSVTSGSSELPDHPLVAQDMPISDLISHYYSPPKTLPSCSLELTHSCQQIPHVLYLFFEYSLHLVALILSRNLFCLQSLNLSFHSHLLSSKRLASKFSHLLPSSLLYLPRPFIPMVMPLDLYKELHPSQWSQFQTSHFTTTTPIFPTHSL